VTPPVNDALALQVVQVGWPTGPKDGPSICAAMRDLLAIATANKLTISCAPVLNLVLPAFPTDSSWIPGSYPSIRGTVTTYYSFQTGLKRRGYWSTLTGSVALEAPDARVGAHEGGHAVGWEHSGLYTFKGVIQRLLRPGPPGVCTQVTNSLENGKQNGNASCIYPDGSTATWRAYGKRGLMGSIDADGDLTQPVDASQLAQVGLIVPTRVGSGIYDVPLAGWGALTTKRKTGEVYWIDRYSLWQRLSVTGAGYGDTSDLEIPGGSIDDWANGGVRITELPGGRAKIEKSFPEVLPTWTKTTGTPPTTSTPTITALRATPTPGAPPATPTPTPPIGVEGIRVLYVPVARQGYPSPETPESLTGRAVRVGDALAAISHGRDRLEASFAPVYSVPGPVDCSQGWHAAAIASMHTPEPPFYVFWLSALDICGRSDLSGNIYEMPGMSVDGALMHELMHLAQFLGSRHAHHGVYDPMKPFDPDLMEHATYAADPNVAGGPYGGPSCMGGPCFSITTFSTWEEQRLSGVLRPGTTVIPRGDGRWEYWVEWDGTRHRLWIIRGLDQFWLGDFAPGTAWTIDPKKQTTFGMAGTLRVTP
jgi:hypothetical protein